VSWIGAHRYWLARRITQLGILTLFWMGAHLHLGILTGNLSASHLFRTVPLADPFAVLQILVTGQSLAGTVLLGALIVAVFYTAVGGRSYCSWVCPVNPIADLAAYLKRRFQIRGQFRVARSTRFWILGLTLPLSAVLGVAAFEWVSPIAMIHRELIFGAACWPRQRSWSSTVSSCDAAGADPCVRWARSTPCWAGARSCASVSTQSAATAAATASWCAPRARSSTTTA